MKAVAVTPTLTPLNLSPRASSTQRHFPVMVALPVMPVLAAPVTLRKSGPNWIPRAPLIPTEPPPPPVHVPHWPSQIAQLSNFNWAVALTSTPRLPTTKMPVNGGGSGSLILAPATRTKTVIEADRLMARLGLLSSSQHSRSCLPPIWSLASTFLTTCRLLRTRMTCSTAGPERGMFTWKAPKVSGGSGLPLHSPP